jgi:hypothetical protein
MALILIVGGSLGERGGGFHALNPRVFTDAFCLPVGQQ